MGHADERGWVNLTLGAFKTTVSWADEKVELRSLSSYGILWYICLIKRGAGSHFFDLQITVITKNSGKIQYKDSVLDISYKC